MSENCQIPRNGGGETFVLIYLYPPFCGPELLNDKQGGLYQGLRQAGIVLTIPMMMAAGPLVGFYIGSWLDQWFATSPVLSTIFAILGLGAGINETVKVIRIIQRDKHAR